MLKKEESLQSLVEEFLIFYKNISSGYNLFTSKNGDINLVLIISDVTEILKSFHAKIDVWYLDGFSPSKNPEMWTKEIFAFIRKNSKPGASFATYTTAGFVREGLLEVGFTVQKEKGFGNKKEMLKGILPIIRQRLSDKPWFRIPKNTSSKKNAIVIGAGIAGTSIAFALAQKGFSITLIEKEERIASAITENLAGMFAPLLTGDASDLSEWNFLAYKEFTKFLALHADKYPGLFSKTGVFEIAKSEEDANRLKKALTISEFNSSDAVFLEGHNSTFNKSPGIFFPNAGWINPFLLTHAYLNLTGSNLKQIRASVIQLERSDSIWKIFLSNSEVLESEIVIMANSFDVKDFFPLFNQIKKVRGQILFFPSRDFPIPLNSVILHEDGYIIPNKNGMHIIGSTFNPNDSSRELNVEHNIHLLQKLKNLIPEINPLDGINMSGLVGFRAMSNDHLPLIGSVPDMDEFKKEYGELWKSNIYKEYPDGKYLPGLYISSAHGSKGILNSYLAANVLASMISGSDQFINEELIQKVNPARFLIKSYIQKKKI